MRMNDEVLRQPGMFAKIVEALNHPCRFLIAWKKPEIAKIIDEAEAEIARITGEKRDLFFGHGYKSLKCPEHPTFRQADVTIRIEGPGGEILAEIHKEGHKGFYFFDVFRGRIPL